MFRSLARQKIKCNAPTMKPQEKNGFPQVRFGPWRLVTCTSYGLIKYEQSTLLPALHNCG